MCGRRREAKQVSSSIGEFSFRVETTSKRRAAGVIIELSGGVFAVGLIISMAAYQRFALGESMLGPWLVWLGVVCFLGCGLSGWGWISADRSITGIVMWLCRGVALVALLGLFGDELAGAECGSRYENGKSVFFGDCAPADLTRHHRLLAFLILWSLVSAFTLWHATTSSPEVPSPGESPAVP